MFLRLWPSDKLLYLPFETRRTETSSANTTSKTSKMALSPKSLAGPGYIILNGIRVMNVIALLAVVIASVVILVKTSIASKFFFFDAVSHVLTALTGLFLLTSELSLFRTYFARNWPLLSPAHGFVTLALAMLVLGINMLGNLNKAAESRKSLGLAFWRIVIASGIVIFILGFVNLFASYVFRDRKQGITARQVRAHGAVAISRTPMTTSSSTPPAPELAQSYIPNPISTSSPNKSGNPFRIRTAERRPSILPSYYSGSDSTVSSPTKSPVSPSSKYSRATNCTKRFSAWVGGKKRQSLAPPLPVNVQHGREMEISGPMGVNPQFAHLVQRPDSAMHPSRTGESEAFRWRAVS